MILICVPLVLLACTKKQEGAVAAAPLSQAEKIAAGERVYKAQCVQCHAANPIIPGSVGPEIAGSSKELVEARVLESSYPPGYTPKRQTKVMPKLPFLKNDIENLAAYLQSVQPAAK
jgi:mono/diheme cytochrome c family protein